MPIETKYTVHVRTSAGVVSNLPAVSEVDAKTQAATQKALGNTVTVVKTDKTLVDAVVTPVPGKK